MRFDNDARPTRRPQCNGLHRRLLAGLLLLSLSACASLNNKEEQRAQQIATELQRAEQAHAAKDYRSAAAILLPLASEGVAAAEYALGYMYHYGQGLPQDQRMALQWIGRAAAKGYPKAEQALLRFQNPNRLTPQKDATPAAEP